jgi:hypothetical protein
MKRATARNDSGSKEPYLKGRNTAYLLSFVSINIALFLCVLLAKTLSESSIDHFWRRITMKNGIFAVGIPILAIVLSGVLGDLGKARLVFWRWKNPLPGCRAFSELLKTDPRINIPALNSKLGDFPSEAHAQNSLWFSVYRRRSAAPRVLEAHKTYLLTRDMATIAAVFAVVFTGALLLETVEWRFLAAYVVALLLQYVLIANAARNYGNRFVLNVLSEESHS